MIYRTITPQSTTTETTPFSFIVGFSYMACAWSESSTDFLIRRHHLWTYYTSRVFSRQMNNSFLRKYYVDD